jgi:hypothetical protein
LIELTGRVQGRLTPGLLAGCYVELARAARAQRRDPWAGEELVAVLRKP